MDALRQTAVAVDLGNWMPTSNPFGLARPPQHFLQALHSYDPDAVIFPSMQEPCYVFARRRATTPGVLRLLNPERHPDLAFCTQHRLIGVTGILPGPHWSPKLLDDLKLMDTWRMTPQGRAGAGDAAADALDRLEAKRQDELDANMVDEADQRGVSAYFGKLVRQGSTTFVRGYNAPR